VKAMERELREYALTLEELVTERTRQLEVEKNRVQELLNMKTQFVNQLSHDLRTPLTPIINMLPLIEADLKDEKELKRFRLVTKNVNYINDLAVSTLALARLDSNTVSFELKPICLRSFVDGVLESNRSTLERAGLKSVNCVSGGLKVLGDEMRLMEVFNNLISNAVKYAPGGGLRFDAVGSSGSVLVSVADDGIGVPPEKLHNLFTEFYKVDTSRHDLSSGLGLAICRRIIEKHNGRVWAESEGLSKGTVIKFTLRAV
jgi:signal transduction histidine kinase